MFKYELEWDLWIRPCHTLEFIEIKVIVKEQMGKN